jgi:hypothetical protein
MIMENITKSRNNHLFVYDCVRYVYFVHDIGDLSTWYALSAEFISIQGIHIIVHLMIIRVNKCK